MKKHVTLIELTIAVIVIVILATIGIPLYKNVLDHSKAKVCQTNLKMLQAAIEVYGLEHDVLPGSLTQLDRRDMERAWAQVMERENPFLIKLAYFLVDLENRGSAYAQDNFLQNYLGGNLKTLICLADPTPPPYGVSYGLNANLAMLPFKVYKKIKNSPEFTVVVADCNKLLFYSLNDLEYRHQKPAAGGKEDFANAYVIGSSTAAVASMDGAGNLEMPEQSVRGSDQAVKQPEDMVASVGDETAINAFLAEVGVDPQAFQMQRIDQLASVSAQGSTGSSSSGGTSVTGKKKVGKFSWLKPSQSSSTSSSYKQKPIKKKKWWPWWW